MNEIRKEDKVTIKNRFSSDPRIIGKVLKVFHDKGLATVWWSLPQEDENPPGIMVQTERIIDLEIASSSEEQ